MMQFLNSYKALGERFYHSNNPMPVSHPSLFVWNASLADSLGMPEDLQQDSLALAEIFSGNRLMEGTEPLSMAYAGHQFGHFNPQLGDGRAHLLGDIQDVQGNYIDIQLKGSGPSAFSRSGDGRCTFSAALREYIMSEAMYALGVPTTRVLAVVRTGEPVHREAVQPGAVVTRTASSHIRVGTFQYFANQGDENSLKKLANYTIERHYPHLLSIKEAEQRYIGLLDAVIQSQITLVVHWLRVGFIHGVMNTDNTAVSGETIDYGPCAMMGVYNPKTVFSSIDRNGRYAYGNQYPIMHWNLTRFAECLLYLVDREDKAIFSQFEGLIQAVPERFDYAYQTMMGAKLGFDKATSETKELVTALLGEMQSESLDYTQTFYQLGQSLDDAELKLPLNHNHSGFYFQWRKALSEQDRDQAAWELMNKNNPVVIPRNHDVERILAEAQANENSSELEVFLSALRSPYRVQSSTLQFQDTQKVYDQSYKTFCGT